MAVTIKLCLMASAGGGGRVEGKFSLESRCRTGRGTLACGLRSSDSVKRVCQKRKQDVEEACGEAAGGPEGQRQAGRGGETFLFSPTQATSCGASQGKLIKRFGLFIYIYI